MKRMPKCKICCQEFSLQGPAPYLLPCLHAVCEACVTSTAGGVISCSTCQREVNLTETQLQKDVVRQRETFHLTVEHRPSELLCTHEDDGNQAVCWCQECEELLCEYCQNMHESFKATRKHIIKDISRLSQSRIGRVHNNNPLDLWDKDCCVLICGRCQREDHVDHQVADVDKASSSAKAEIEAQRREIMSIAECQKAVLQKTNEQLCTPDFTTISENVSHTVHSLKDQLDQIEKETIIDLEQHTEMTTSNLQTQSKTSQTACNRCDITIDYIDAALIHLSKTELLPLKNTIRETTQSCLASVPDVLQPKRSAEILRHLKSRIAEACNTTAAGDNSERIQDETDTEQVGEKQEQFQQKGSVGGTFWMTAVYFALVCIVWGIGNQTMKSDEAVSCGSLNAQAQETQGKFEGCQHRLTKATNEGKELEASVSQLNMYVEVLQQNLSSAKTKIEELSHDLNIATYQKEETQNEARENREGRQKMERETEILRTSVEALNRYMELLERNLSSARTKIEELNHDLTIATYQNEETQKEARENREGIQKAEREIEIQQASMESSNRYVELLERNLSSARSKIEELNHDLDIATYQKEETPNEARENWEGRKNAEEKQKAEREADSLRTSVKSLNWELEKDKYINGKDKKVYKYPDLTYDRDRVNLKMTHISKEGYLVNQPGTVFGGNSENRFEVYEGTCSTSPLPQSPHALYWEVRAHVYIKKPLPLNHLLLEIALCKEEDRDVVPRIPDRPHTISLVIIYCYKYGSFCRGIRKDGYWVSLLPFTLHNTAMSHAILHYGVLFDHTRSRVAFIDVNDQEIISDFIDIDTSEKLWPMFGVYNQDWANVQMKPVVGEDIEMTDQKEDLILKILS